MKRILIFGATSTIAQECANIFAARGDRVFLVGRDVLKLQAIADHLKVLSGAETAFCQADLLQFDTHGKVIEKALTSLGDIDIALIAHGVLGIKRDASAPLRTPGTSSTQTSLARHRYSRC